LGIGSDSWAGGGNAVPFVIFGFINQSTVSFGAATSPCSLSRYSAPQQAADDDSNVDGYPDLVVGEPSSVPVLLNQGVVAASGKASPIRWTIRVVSTRLVLRLAMWTTTSWRRDQMRRAEF
jgi:hypothetical protein